MTGSRAEKVALIRAIQAAQPELTRRQIADLLGLKLATLHNLLNDPDGSKQATRRQRYRRPCVNCGRLLDGSNGRRQPRGFTGLCKACAATAAHATKRWTRDAVIDAIQRYAAANGRPPTATDWLRADREHGYPAATSVYSHRSSPFATWSEAIEAAGFPRPRVGQRPGQRWWSRRLLVEEIRRRSRKGIAPACGSTLYVEAHYYFGSWAAACAAAGVTPASTVRIKWTRESLIAWARANAVHGYLPAFNGNVGAVYRVFGSTRAFAEAAGLRTVGKGHSRVRLLAGDAA